MEKKQENNKGKVILIFSIVMFLFGMFILFTSYEIVANDSSWYFSLALLASFILQALKYKKTKEKYNFIGSIILILTTVAFLIPRLINFIK